MVRPNVAMTPVGPMVLVLSAKPTRSGSKQLNGKWTLPAAAFTETSGGIFTGERPHGRRRAKYGTKVSPLLWGSVVAVPCRVQSGGTTKGDVSEGLRGRLAGSTVKKNAGAVRRFDQPGANGRLLQLAGKVKSHQK